MSTNRRPAAFWVVTVILVVSAVSLLAGQTLGVFNYDLAVRFGLQEHENLVGRYGVELNRAFGVGDTIIYLPLMIISLVGLFLRKDWALLTSAAVMGISAYWPVTVGFMLVFLEGVPEYKLIPGPGYWILMGPYLIFGIGGLFYLGINGKRLIE